MPIRTHSGTSSRAETYRQPGIGSDLRPSGNRQPFASARGAMGIRPLQGDGRLARRPPTGSGPIPSPSNRKTRSKRSTASALVRARNLVIDIEDVVPRFALHRARLDLSQVRSLRGEYLQRLDQRARTVLHRKRDRDLIGAGIALDQLQTAESRKNRVKFAGLSSMPAARISPPYCSAACALAIAAEAGISGLDHLLHATRRVIKRDGLHLGMLLEKPPALRERDRMRRDSPNLVHARSWQRDQIVANPQQRFALDRHILVEQQIVVFRHRTSE